MQALQRQKRIFCLKPAKRSKLKRNTDNFIMNKLSPVTRRKFSYFNRTLLLFNYSFIVCLFMAYLARYVSPDNFSYFSFFGLAYPVFFILNLLFVLYWIALFSYRFVYSLVAVLIGWPLIFSFVQVDFFQKNKTASNTDSSFFKVMSYNVRLFDLYNWSHNKETRNKIFDFLLEESPSVMCLQEFYKEDSEDFKTVDTIVQFHIAKNHHIEYTNSVQNKYHFGIATFTKYPIVAKGRVKFPEANSNICIYTDIKINEDTVRIYNMHLQSIHFGKSDYKYVDDLIQNKETEDIENSMNIMRRLKRAFSKRSIQADLIDEHMSNCRYPMIVCGDFNDTPSSYAYHTILKNKKDAFVESGNGFGRTYIGKFPSFRIDYIFYSPSFLSANFRTIRKELSDHYPVVCFLKKNN